MVDSGSTDETRSIAESEGAIVLTEPFRGYGRQKQFACSRARNEWILSIDADEVVTGALRESILHELEKGPGHKAYAIPRRFHFLGKRFAHGRGAIDYPVRLFHAGAAGFNSDSVHERVVVDGTIGRLHGELDHYSYTTLEQYLGKFNTYTSLAAQQIVSSGKKRSVLGTAMLIPVTFITHYVFRLNCLHGWQGLVWSVLSTVYPLVKVAKARSLRHDH